MAAWRARNVAGLILGFALLGAACSGSNDVAAPTSPNSSPPVPSVTPGLIDPGRVAECGAKGPPPQRAASFVITLPDETLGKSPGRSGWVVQTGEGEAITLPVEVTVPDGVLINELRFELDAAVVAWAGPLEAGVHRLSVSWTAQTNASPDTESSRLFAAADIAEDTRNPCASRTDSKERFGLGVISVTSGEDCVDGVSDSFGDFNGDGVDEAAIAQPNPDGGWLVGWCAGGQQEWAQVPGMNAFPLVATDLNDDGIDELLVAGSFGRGTYINLVAANEDGGAVFVDLNAVHTFDGLEPPTQDLFTASTYMCRGADDKLRIVVVQYEPEGSDVSERMGNVALDTSPLRPRIDWATRTVGSVIDMAAAWAKGGQCIIE